MTITISAAGDMCFHSSGTGRISEEALSEIAYELRKSHISIGNLENPLLLEGRPVEGKCCLKADPAWGRIIKKSGINVVSLANNHMMDFGEEGLLSTISALDGVEVLHVGAGRDRKEACAPCYMKVGGTQVALLGRSSVIVSSPCYADEKRAGVAFLDIEETKERIRECRRKGDLVVVLVHWGLEEYSYPSPSQRQLAKELIETGADLILGHHSHVLQGVERVNHGLVAYSMGNFFFDNIQWSFVDQEGQLCERVVELGNENRKAGILKVTLAKNGVESYDLIPTFIKPGGKVVLEETPDRKKEFALLCSGLNRFQYPLFWKAYSLRQEWLLRVKPLIHGKITWSKLKKVRLKHFKEMANNVRRSSRIIVERTTNPYE